MRRSSFLIVLSAIVVTVELVFFSAVFLPNHYKDQLSVPVPGTKDYIWQNLKLNSKKILNQHQYCTLWCPADEYLQVSEWDLYRDISSEQARKRGSYYKTEDRDFYQTSSQKVLNITCCQVATHESFSILVDSRRSDNVEKDVTLVTYGTFERFEALAEIRRRWSGPIVAVLVVQDHNDLIYESTGKKMTSQQELAAVRKQLEDPIWDNTAIVVYYGRYEKDQKFLKIGYNANYFKLSTYSYNDTKVTKPYSREETRARDLVLLVDFPINTLRNVAQDYAETRYVFAVDIDFLPDNSMYEFFKKQLSKISQLDKAGIVVPHFERRPKCDWLSKEYEYPADFKTLDLQIRAALIRPFYCDLYWWYEHHPDTFHWTAEDMKETNCTVVKIRHPNFFAGINITDYVQWFNSSRNRESADIYELPLDVISSSLFQKGYEPYLLLDRVANGTHALMRYNEVFVNRHRDKASWIFGLRLTGYRFFVAKEHFLIHRNHPYSPWVESTAGGLPGNKGPSEFLRERMFLAANKYIEVLTTKELADEINSQVY
jgi:hypothetical protein